MLTVKKNLASILPQERVQSVAAARAPSPSHRKGPGRRRLRRCRPLRPEASSHQGEKRPPPPAPPLGPARHGRSRSRGPGTPTRRPLGPKGSRDSRRHATPRGRALSAGAGGVFGRTWAAAPRKTLRAQGAATRQARPKAPFLISERAGASGRSGFAPKPRREPKYDHPWLAPVGRSGGANSTRRTGGRRRRSSTSLTGYRGPMHYTAALGGVGEQNAPWVGRVRRGPWPTMATTSALTWARARVLGVSCGGGESHEKFTPNRPHTKATKPRKNQPKSPPAETTGRNRPSSQAYSRDGGGRTLPQPAFSLELPMPPWDHLQ